MVEMIPSITWTHQARTGWTILMRRVTFGTFGTAAGSHALETAQTKTFIRQDGTHSPPLDCSLNTVLGWGIKVPPAPPISRMLIRLRHKLIPDAFRMPSLPLLLLAVSILWVLMSRLCKSRAKDTVRRNWF